MNHRSPVVAFHPAAVVSLIVLASACGGGASTPESAPGGTTPAGETAPAGEAATADADIAEHLDPDDPMILRRPFTADEIRDGWVPGLSIDVRRATPDGEVLERWTVVGHDAGGADIEYRTLDADGNPTDEARTVRSPWTELRDHATFPADRATREAATRETPLGTLDGWVYVVRNENAGSVTEMFFAESMPGAPITVRTTRGDELLMEMSQLKRQEHD